MESVADPNPFARLTRAMVVYTAFEERQRAGSVETLADLLAAHPELRELLQDLADGEASGDLEPVGDASPPMTAPTPTRVGHYRLIRPLGQGAHGAVWLAFDTRVHREVALKLLNQTGIDDDTRLARFAREAQAVSQLDHPGICGVFDLEAKPPQPWIAMPYVAGETLEQHLTADSRPTMTRERLEAHALLVERVARALHHAHQRGLVHRDVKPSNVMVTPAGDPVLLDFGIVRQASVAGDLTLTGDVIGSPAYMAPEQLASEPVDARADVWALGVVLYECLAGRRPFAAPTRERLLLEIRDAALPPLRRQNSHVPKDLDIVVRKALEKHVDDRYPSAAALADDLRRWRAREPVLARRSSIALRTWRWSQRQPLAASLITSLALALFLLAWFAKNAFDLAVRESEALAQTSIERKRTEASDAGLAFQAACTEASYGRWKAAEGLYDQAQARGYDEIAVQLGRIEIWDATFASDRSRTALDQLATRADLGRHAALVTVMRYDLSRVLRGEWPADWQAQIQGVASSADLSDAWRAYARALLADSLPAAREHIEAALAFDRRHRAANEMLWPLVLLTGGPASALVAAQGFGDFYPDDPAAAFMKVACLRLLDRGEDAARLVEAHQIPRPEQHLIEFVARYRDAVRDGFGDLLTLGMQKYLGAEASTRGVLIGASVRLISTFSVPDDLEDVRFMLRLPPATRRLGLTSLMPAIAAANLGRTTGLDRVIEVAPLASFFAIRSGARNVGGDIEGAWLDVQAAVAAGDDLFGLAERVAYLRVALSARRYQALVTATDDVRAAARADAVHAIEHVLRASRPPNALELRYIASRAVDIDEPWLMRECAGRLRRTQPSDPDIATQCARLTLRAGMTAASRLEIEAIVRQWPNHAPAREVLAEILRLESAAEASSGRAAK